MAVAAVVTGFVLLGRGFRDSGATGVTAGTSRLGSVALAVVWGSPALWLGLPPLLLADGTRGLWAPVVAVGGAVVALLLLGTSWSRTGGLVGTASMMAQSRWPSARACHALLVSTETVVAGLFVWAQLAAVREVGAMVGWPLATTIGVAALVVGAQLLPDLLRTRLTALGGSVALVGLWWDRLEPPWCGRKSGVRSPRAPAWDLATGVAGPGTAARCRARRGR